jgi:hypothetical protein
MTVRGRPRQYFVWANRQSRGLSFGVNVPILTVSIR